jgi:hypothetical protein
MEQLKLPMLTVYEGPRLVDRELIAACRSYREAVRMCWQMRTRTNLTKSKLVEEINELLALRNTADTRVYASHVTDYLSEKPSKRARNLPPDTIDAFERSCGNRFISQWNAHQAGLPVLDATFMEHLGRMQRMVA